MKLFELRDGRGRLFCAVEETASQEKKVNAYQSTLPAGTLLYHVPGGRVPAVCQLSAQR